MKKFIQKLFGKKLTEPEKTEKPTLIMEFFTEESLNLIIEKTKGTKCPVCKSLDIHLNSRVFYINCVNTEKHKPVYLIECRQCDFVMHKNLDIFFRTADGSEKIH